MVVEDDAVLQYLTHAGSLVLVGCLEDFHSAGRIGGHGACKEVSACSEAQLGGPEGVLHRAVGAALAHETAWTGGAVLTLGKAVDAVVEQYHVEVDVASVGMYEVVAADGQAVAVAAHLPYGELGIGHLASCCYGSRTSVDGIHAIGSHIVRQSA